MKKIGLIYDKESKYIAILPSEIKKLVDKGVTINVLSGYGKCIKIEDNSFSSLGAHIFHDWKEVIANSDVLVKTNAFNKAELEKIGDKVAITMVNYLTNVNMLYYMLQNKTTGLEWKCLRKDFEFSLFNKIEEAKAEFVVSSIQNALKTGLSKKPKEQVTYPTDPKILILNASPAGLSIAKQAVALGWKVTVAENDTNKVSSLKKAKEFKSVEFIDAGFESLVSQFKTSLIFVNTIINPLERTKLRITKEMALSMPKGSILVDEACENGYAFHFVKKFADKELRWNKLNHVYYLAHEDISSLIAQKISQIISIGSVDSFFGIAKEGIENKNILALVNCKDSKVTNALINNELKLY